MIAATHQDLDQLVAQAKFRPDLFYRLQGVRLRLPPLRDRLRRFAHELGLQDRYDLHVDAAGPGVDAFAFHEKGIPAATLCHFPYDEYHLPSERLELVDERRLDDSVELATLLVESLLEQPVAPVPASLPLDL